MARSIPSVDRPKEAAKSKKDDDSLFNQISSVISGKKRKFSSVQEAVEEMRERSGVISHRKKESEKDASKDVVKNASKKPDYTPQLLKKFPEIKNTFENYIQQTKGNVSIPGIIEHVHNIHKFDVNNESLWNDQKLLVYVSQLNLGAKQNNPATYHQYHDLGKLDHSESDVDIQNTDAFNSLMPSTALK